MPEEIAPVRVYPLNQGHQWMCADCQRLFVPKFGLLGEPTKFVHWDLEGQPCPQEGMAFATPMMEFPQVDSAAAIVNPIEPEEAQSIILSRRNQ